MTQWSDRLSNDLSVSGFFGTYTPPLHHYQSAAAAGTKVERSDDFILHVSNAVQFKTGDPTRDMISQSSWLWRKREVISTVR